MIEAIIKGARTSQIGDVDNASCTCSSRKGWMMADIIMVFAAWFHSPIGIAAGLAIAIAAWGYGLVLPSKGS